MLPQSDNDKSRDFRGEWKTRCGNYALIEEPVLAINKGLMGWHGKLFKPDGTLISNQHDWHSSGCATGLWANDLMERKRGNETNWPNLQHENKTTPNNE